MPKLMLIYPSCLYAPDWGWGGRVKSHMLNLFSFLKRNNIKVEVLDLENEIGRPETKSQVKKFKENAIRLISQYDFNIVAIFCSSSLNYLSTIMIADICKNVNSKSTIVVDGYHPSALPYDFIYPKSPFDFIVKGEGETALLNICKGKERKSTKPELIQGLPLDLKKNFDLDWQNYRYSEKHNQQDIYLSRGCPFSCDFCMEPCKGYGRWRSYSVDQAIGKIKKLIDIKNPGEIYILDACFGFDKAWRRKFLSGLIKNKIDKIFWAESRIDLLDKEDIDLLSKLNFEIHFGLESGSEKMLYLMRKTNRPTEYLKKCENLITYMNKKEVLYGVNLMFNHPGETYATYTSTIKFLKSLIKKQSKISGFFGGQDYKFFPGSHIHKYLKDYEKKYGTVIKHKEWWKEQGDHLRLAETVIPSRDLMDGHGKINYWQKEISDLGRQCAEKMPISAKIFRWVKKPYRGEEGSEQKMKKTVNRQLSS